MTDLKFKEWIEESKQRNGNWELCKEEEEERASFAMLDYIEKILKRGIAPCTKERIDNLMEHMCNMTLLSNQTYLIGSVIEVAEYELIEIAKEYSKHRNNYVEVYEHSKLIHDLKLWVKNCMVLKYSEAI